MFQCISCYSMFCLSHSHTLLTSRRHEDLSSPHGGDLAELQVVTTSNAQVPLAGSPCRLTWVCPGCTSSHLSTPAEVLLPEYPSWGRLGQDALTLPVTVSYCGLCLAWDVACLGT